MSWGAQKLFHEQLSVVGLLIGRKIVIMLIVACEMPAGPAQMRGAHAQ